MSHFSNIAFLGTGLMGQPMARNLLKSGFSLTVWNRSPDKAQALAIDGATLASSVADAVDGADLVISMLADGAVTGAAIDAVAGTLKTGTLWIDMCSAKPEEARTQAALLQSFGHSHLDAPVSGGTKGADAASLAIMVGGSAVDFDRAATVFQAMGRPVHVGPTGSGQLSKLANQAIVGITIGAVAEAILMVEKGGADPSAVRRALKGGFADSVILQQHGERMSDVNFTPGGPVKFQIKDLLNCTNEAAALSLELPLTQQVLEQFTRLSDELDGADLDHSALFLELKNRNGL
jgi:2-hydroxy-3-oxopropionate reductase